MRVISAATSGPIVQQLDEIQYTTPPGSAGTFAIVQDVPIQQVVSPGSVAYAQFSDPPSVVPVVVVGAYNPVAGHLLITMYYLDDYAGGTVPLRYSLTEHGQ